VEFLPTLLAGKVMRSVVSVRLNHYDPNSPGIESRYHRSRFMVRVSNYGKMVGLALIPPGPQQQTRRSSLRLPDGTDRRTTDSCIDPHLHTMWTVPIIVASSE